MVRVPAFFQNTKNRGAVKIKSFCQFLGGNAFLILVANLVVAVVLPLRKSHFPPLLHLSLCDMVDGLWAESVLLREVRDLCAILQCIGNFSIAFQQLLMRHRNLPK